MAVITKNIKLETKGDTQVIDITGDVTEALRDIEITSGIVTVFIPGSTASITTIEFESGAVADYKEALDRMAPTDFHYEHNARWGDGNGYAHVRAALQGPSLTVPFLGKRLLLGTWQQIIFVDFDNRPRSREIVLQIIGE